MAHTIAVTRASNSSIKYAILEFAKDASYVGTAGEVIDLSATGADLGWTEVYGGCPISKTINDAGTISVYCRDGDATGASGAPALGTMQEYWQNEIAASRLVLVTGTTDISEQNNEYWIFFGR